ncbi:MAG TPA: endonuclease domain-containing protein [Rhodanobacteraceae bacterium]
MREGAKTGFARALRRDMTDAERHLWWHLRMRQMARCRFRRQHPIGPYIADFACIERQLVVEVDGSQHFESDHDARRDAWFAQNHFRVLRFWNHDVLNRTNEVLAAILAALDAGPHPGLPPQAGEGDKP